MERGAVRAMAARLGLAEPALLRKAEEYLRLSQVKCTGFMAQMTATSSAVMCLDLAASFMKQPVDKVNSTELSKECLVRPIHDGPFTAEENLVGPDSMEALLMSPTQTLSYCVKLSGLNKTTYQSSMKSLECLLEVNQKLGMRDLAVQFCCSEAVKMASEILQRCLKLKVDKTKMLATSGVKKAIFDRLCNQLEKISQQLSKDVPVAAETPDSLQSALEQCEQEADSEEDEEMPCKRPKTETNQDYEEWKKKILENAAKAQETRRSESVMPASNATAACS
ncbi:hypothetical protein DUI87_14062 [Hirundo rustica rustica]|uniref:Origin recognition complex subunit 6 n=1 Tax=Hirundo rustica rustica TaxID=333673 RepID=A0A3M0KPN2_HIRRU|nr:hypothetical protein DUI87_14062 [Hirundo rustica rustica]